MAKYSFMIINKLGMQDSEDSSVNSVLRFLEPILENQDLFKQKVISADVLANFIQNTPEILDYLTRFNVFNSGQILFNFGTEKKIVVHSDYSAELCRNHEHQTDFGEALKYGIEVGTSQRDNWSWFHQSTHAERPKVIPKTFESPTYPRINFVPDHIYGFRSKDIRNNVFFMGNDFIGYTSGSTFVMQEIATGSQSFFTEHYNHISAICVEKNMVATAEMTKQNNIILWDWAKVANDKSPGGHELKIRKRAVLYEYFNTGIAYMSFNGNSNILAVAGSGNCPRIVLFDLKTIEASADHNTNYSCVIGSHRLVNQHIISLVFDCYEDSLLIGTTKSVYKLKINHQGNNNEITKYDLKEFKGEKITSLRVLKGIH
jgi:hypothetical protein